MGASSNTHASSIFAITIPKDITQIKKQRTRQIHEQKNGMVETRKDARTDLRVRSHSKETQKISQNRKTIRLESFLQINVTRTGEKDP